ncbi:MAG: HrpE/YscL family type III secretion apparatus protein [Candidatus Adiutrix sp.]|nr:HrpE/YscL family type III secretion apparatus protein [Candidatus Adiutrix sp.]
MGRFLLKDGRLAVPPEVRILRAAEYGELLRASEVLAVAAARAEQMAREAEEVYAERQKEGYEEGLLAGKMEMAERMMDQIISGVEYVERQESTLVEAVIGALRKILGDMGEEERAVAVVRKALSYVRAQKKALLRLNPEDAETVNEKLGEILREYPGLGLVEVAADSRLAKGSCTLESELGVIDASLETQIEAIRRSFLRRLTRQN